MIAYFWVALGGALGSVSRYWLSGLVANRIGSTFPWGTIIVNAHRLLRHRLFQRRHRTEGRWLLSPTARTFFMIGICGGYTTFSSFSLQP